MDLLLPLAVACISLIVLVRVFATSLGQRAASEVRRVDAPWDASWLSVDEVAERLSTTPAEIVNLVERDAIPHFVGPGLPGAESPAYWFSRAEIDQWVIG